MVGASLSEGVLFACDCRCAEQMVMSNCQTVLENADTPDVLFAIVDVISFIVKNHPHCFRPHFRVCTCFADPTRSV